LLETTLGSEKDKVSAGVNPADNARLEKSRAAGGFPPGRFYVRSETG
jgi:hypothetical protein